MQSQVLKFLLKENKFNSQAQGIKVIFLPPPVCTMTFFSQCPKATQRFRGQRNPEVAVGDVVHVFCVHTTIRKGWVFLGGGVVYVWGFQSGCSPAFWCGAMGLRIWTRAGGGGGQRGGNKTPSSQETAHYIPIHWACSCKILILAFKYNPVEWKTLWWCLLILFDNGREKKW